MTPDLNEGQPTTGWFDATVHHPALPGYYEVRNGAPVHHRHRAFLLGSRFRYWNGSEWLTDDKGGPSIFGKHVTHQWRGVRMWVLRRLSGGADAFLIDARPRFNAWSRHVVEARPFKSERTARRFADRHPRLGLTAVLA